MRSTSGSWRFRSILVASARGGGFDDPQRDGSPRGRRRPFVARLARIPNRSEGVLPRSWSCCRPSASRPPPIAEGLEVTLWTTNTVGDARLAATTTTTSKKVLSPPSFAAANGCSTELLRVMSREEDAKAQEVCRCPMTNSPPQTHVTHTNYTHEQTTTPNTDAHTGRAPIRATREARRARCTPLDHGQVRSILDRTELRVPGISPNKNKSGNSSAP
jgi:hypothetical protein